MFVAICYFELHFRTLRASYPVTLSLFQRVCPVYCVKTVKKSLSVCTYTETPLAHLLLYNGETATNRDTIDNLVVGEYGTKTGTPVHHSLSEVSYAVVHQHLLLLLLVHSLPLVSGEGEFLALSDIESLSTFLVKVLNELLYWLCTLTLVAIETVEHLLERPLCPFVVAWQTCAYLAVPVERETYLVKLTAIAVYVLESGLLGVLSCLNSILLGRQSVSVITHRVKYVKSLLALEASIYIAGDVS